MKPLTNFLKLIYLFSPPVIWMLRNKLDVISRNRTRRRNFTKHNKNCQTSALALAEAEKLLRIKFGDTTQVRHSRMILESCTSTSRPFGNSLSQWHTEAEKLANDGFVVLKGAIDETILKEKSDKIWRTLDEIRSTQLTAGFQSDPGRRENKKVTVDGVKYHIEMSSGIIRGGQITNIFPDISGIFNKKIETFFNEYFKSPAIFSDVLCEYKWLIDGYDVNTTFHFDRSVDQYKLFVPLNVIGVDQAPLVYLPRSHILNEWRLYRDHLNLNYRDDFGLPNFREFAELEINNIQKLYGNNVFDDPTTVTAAVGDVIVFNTRGLHRGSALRDGYRLQLGMIVSSLQPPMVNR
jgi:hypothetical protein